MDEWFIYSGFQTEGVVKVHIVTTVGVSKLERLGPIRRQNWENENWKNQRIDSYSKYGFIVKANQKIFMESGWIPCYLLAVLNLASLDRI